MFPTFVLPPKDQDADVRFLNSVWKKSSLDAEANSNDQYIRWHSSERWLFDFEIPKHTTAPQRQNTLQTVAIEVRECQAAAARQMAREAVSLVTFCSVRVCERG